MGVSCKILTYNIYILATVCNVRISTWILGGIFCTAQNQASILNMAPQFDRLAKTSRNINLRVQPIISTIPKTNIAPANGYGYMDGWKMLEDEISFWDGLFGEGN